MRRHLPSRNCIRSKGYPSRMDTAESKAIDCVRQLHYLELRKRHNAKCIVAPRLRRRASLELAPMWITRMFYRCAMHSCKRCSDRTIILAMWRIGERMSRPIPSLGCGRNHFRRRIAVSNRPTVWCDPVDIGALLVFDCVGRAEYQLNSPALESMVDLGLPFDPESLDSRPDQERRPNRFRRVILAVLVVLANLVDRPNLAHRVVRVVLRHFNNKVINCCGKGLTLRFEVTFYSLWTWVTAISFYAVSA